MLFIGSVGASLITMAVLEKQGKISINHTVLYILSGGLAVYGGWEVLEKITKTFLL